MTLKERFWSRVLLPNADGCMEWTGAVMSSGYGSMWIGDKKELAHRVAMFLITGEWPPSGLYVCHRCDNPLCVRPDHLFIGTPLDNNIDKIRKGRYRNGTSDVTHCIHGHPFDSSNTRFLHQNGNTRRQCKQCCVDRNRVRRARLRYEPREAS